MLDREWLGRRLASIGGEAGRHRAAGAGLTGPIPWRSKGRCWRGDHPGIPNGPSTRAQSPVCHIRSQAPQTADGGRERIDSSCRADMKLDAAPYAERKVGSLLKYLNMIQLPSATRQPIVACRLHPAACRPPIVLLIRPSAAAVLTWSMSARCTFEPTLPTSTPTGASAAWQFGLSSVPLFPSLCLG